MQKKPLKELLQEFEHELTRLGYTEGSMKFYRNRWKKIIQFAEQRDEIFYSEQLGINYVEHHYQILEKDFAIATKFSWILLSHEHFSKAS